MAFKNILEAFFKFNRSKKKDRGAKEINMINLQKYFINNQLKIIVKPNSKENEIKDYDANKKALRINIKAKAEHNKANVEIIKFLKKLGYNVEIVKGLKSKEKILRIYG